MYHEITDHIIIIKMYDEKLHNDYRRVDKMTDVNMQICNNDISLVL